MVPVSNPLTKEDTNVVKGVAICLMLIHHLFYFPERIEDVEYFSLFSTSSGTAIEFIIGRFGNICVSFFLFLSGYGMYISAKKSKNIALYSIHRLRNFLSFYWVCFIIFIPIGLLFFRYNPRYALNFPTLLLNLIGVSDSYNGEWWFVKLYIELIILFSVIYFMLKRNTFYAVLISCFLLMYGKKIEAITGGDWLNLSILFFWQFSFVLGGFFAKHNIFRYLPDLASKKKWVTILNYTLILTICFLFHINFKRLSFDLLLTPLLIFYSARLINQIKAKKIFIVLGQNSLYMWLTHTFFCYYYWQNFIFIPKYSVLIFLWLVLLTLVTSFILNSFHRLLSVNLSLK